jgi:phage shock protein PspC (stress-responsive transcriptional regulator)
VSNTIDVRIGTTVFHIEESAYRALGAYLDDIQSRLEPASASEVMSDLEMRIADHLSGWLGNPNGVVDIYLVRKVQEVIGRPEEFGELRRPQSGHLGQNEAIKRLMRTSGDKVIGGVCGGIAKFTNIDPTLLRLLTMFLILFGGLSLWIYIILWILLPLDSKQK